MTSLLNPICMNFRHWRLAIGVWADTQRGRIIFTNSKGRPGVGLPRAEWNEIRALQSGTVKRTVTDTTLPTGPIEREIINHPPSTKCDRETDYAEVWRKLEERK